MHANLLYPRRDKVLARPLCMQVDEAALKRSAKAELTARLAAHPAVEEAPGARANAEAFRRRALRALCSYMHAKSGHDSDHFAASIELCDLASGTCPHAAVERS